MGKTALLAVFGMSLVLGSMLVGLNKRTTSQNEFISGHYERMISRNIANSAANIAVSKLFQDYNWRTGLTTTSMVGGYYAADIQDINFDTTVAVQRVKVTATSTYGGVTDTVIAVVARAPFSYYAQFTANWPTSTNSYVTGDTLYGPIHTNTKFKFGGSPVFFGKVSSVDTSYETWGGGEPQFLGGTEFGAQNIPMPTFASGLQALEDSANAGGDVYSDDVWLKFYADGSYDYYVGSSFDPINGTWDGTKYLSSLTHPIIMSENNPDDMHVMGTVSGQLTLYSGGSIHIEDDLVYADDPSINPSSQDMLGLVASKDIVVVDTPANQSDVEIHGALLAVGLGASLGKFYVEDLNSGPFGTMTLLGATIQKNRGSRAKGSVNGQGEVVITHGYALKSYYDDRFLHVGPPGFPTAQKTVLYSWLEDTNGAQGYGVNTGYAGGQGAGGYQGGAGEVN